MNRESENPPSIPACVDDRGEEMPRRHNTYERGITLRDYYVGQALTGILSADFVPAYGFNGVAVAEDVARCAYALADALLAARKP